MRVLIAEDDLTSRTILAALLNKWGYESVVTKDGAEAWEVLQQPDAPKLVLLDWNMPGMDGLEVCRRLRENDSTTPAYVILLTVREAKGDIVRGFEAGANDYISKPYDHEELQARIGVGQRMLELQDKLAERMRELQAALDDVRTLRGIIPICMHCKKVRDDQGYWKQVETYVGEHSEAQFSHGICPECTKSLYSDGLWGGQ